MTEPAGSVRSGGISTRLLAGLWIILGCLLASLIALAILLLVKMNFFSTDALTDEQLKAVWAFVGVALGAVVTLIGTLLTEQHSRRTEAITSEAAERELLAKAEQQALAAQAERRLTIDTVSKTLELITTDSGAYAERAKVGGAIATMMELQGGTVAIRILGELWAADAVDSDTAVWLINRVLKESGQEDELVAAADLLVYNVSKLVAGKNDAQQERQGWPALLRDSWPEHLPFEARNSLLVMALKLLLVRERTYWQESGTTFPVDLLYGALDDPQFSQAAAFTLAKLHELDLLQALYAPNEEQLAQIRLLSENYTPFTWYVDLLAQFEPWARGEDVRVAAATTGSVGVAATESSPSPGPPSKNAETPRGTEEPNPSDPD